MADENSAPLHTVQLIIERMDARVEASLANFSDRLARIEKKTDALHEIVAGNGSDTSLVMRMALMETRLGHTEQEMSRRYDEATTQRAAMNDKIKALDTALEAMKDQQEAWRNRAIGVGIALSCLGGGVALLGQRIIQLVAGP